MEQIKVKVNINPAPANKCCMKCGKHVGELKPFGKAGDPLIGDFDGALLVKTFRAMNENVIEEFDKILDEYKFNIDGTGKDNTAELELKYGKDKVESAFYYDQLSSTVKSSWECRDCIVI